MDELEYITTNALMMCDQGGAPDFFKPTYNTKIKIHGCLVATKVDFTPLVNIPSFKICMVTQKPCVPVTIPWENTWAVKVMGQETLIGRSKCRCTIGGTIEFMTSGQIPLPDDAQAEVEDMQKQAQQALDDAGYGDSVGEAGFVEGMIPVWGSGRDMVNDIQTGDVGGAIMNAGFLVWDVASIAVGVFTFGGGTVAMQAGKAGMKGAIKAGAKTISKKMLQGLGKTGFKKLSKEVLSESLKKTMAKLARKPVTADTAITLLLRGEKIVLNNIIKKPFKYVKRNADEVADLRKAFNNKERKKFLQELSKNEQLLKSKGFSDSDIKAMQRGLVPDDYQVHHKFPLDDNGTNNFDNLVLIKNDPYHQALTNYQNSVTKGMKAGDSKTIEWYTMNGSIYP
ncbi:hypothetical protein AGMMS50239_07000 [Bacteroidia bacterium]|nr:hypothetical protein AGMMS50239_07000 [Bacteroidia bacterium]